MNFKKFKYFLAYLIFGSIFIKLLSLYVPFKISFAVGMIFCFAVSVFEKFEIVSILVLSGIYVIILYLDNYFSIYWISAVKQDDYPALIGSYIFFAIPGISGYLLNRVILKRF